MLTYFALAFVVLLIAAILYGFGIVMRRPEGLKELGAETCVLCRQKFEKANMVEREIGDYKLFYFCQECIESLHSDAVRKDGTAAKKIARS